MTNLGENITFHRRKMGLTQEALGAAGGVSMQAVSKWENGGLPDTALLPAIARALETSIDALFGMDASLADVEQAIASELTALAQGKRMRRSFELCWAIERSMFGERALESADAVSRYISRENEMHSQMLTDTGITLMKLDRASHYFFLSPEPEEGWGKRLVNPDAHTKLFAFLSQRDVYDLLVFLYKRDKNPFTLKLIEAQLSIPAERGREILKHFDEYELVLIKQLELDDESIEVFTSAARPSLIGLLTFANEMCNPPTSFSWYNGNRDQPFFRTEA
ncbi:MAG: helix-turn-helix domain-containing protein [Christensenellales bacterium]|jgi:transcriptional regulator with XRE-family HTH domain